MTSNRTETVVATVLLLLCGTTNVTAQSSPTPVAARVPSPLTVLKVRPDDGPVSPVTALTMDPARYARLKQPHTITITSFPLDAATRVDLDLQRFEILADGARIVVHTDQGDRVVAPPDVVLLRGTIAGLPESRVFLGMTPRGANGFIRIGDTQYIIAAAPGAGNGPTVIYDVNGLPDGALNTLPFVCGTDALQNVANRALAAAGAGTQAAAGPPSCTLEAQIAIETDWEFTEFFDGDTELSEAYILTLMGAVSEIYSNDIGVGLVVSHMSVWDMDNDPWTEPGAQGQLFQFMDFWNLNMTEVPRHAAHFLTTRELIGASGVAFQPGLCQGDYAYGLSGYIEGSFPYPLEIDGHLQNWDLVVVAHELGHNFGAPHTHNMEPPVDECAYGACIIDPETGLIEGTIMSYCHLCEGGLANINLFFHERTISEGILPYLTEQLPCTLSDEVVEITSEPGSLTLCVNDTATFTVTAVGQPPITYQWRKNTVDIVGATGAVFVINVVTLGSAGIYDVIVSTDCDSVQSLGAVLVVDTCDPPPPPPPPPPPSCPGDVDGDNTVGITDFLALLGQWGTNPGGPPDFDGDGDVGITDFLILLGNWGPC